MTDIAISVPTRGLVDMDFLNSLMMLAVHTSRALPDIVIRSNYRRSSMLPENRRLLVEDAKEQKCTHMLFLDDDMLFPRNTLELLLRHDKPIVAANYITREPPHVPTAARDNRHLYSLNRKGLEAADHVGLGVCLIAMSVFDLVPAPYFPFGWSQKQQETIGEDVMFCRMARQAEIPLFIDHDLSNQVGHIGRVVLVHEMSDAALSLDVALAQGRS